MVKQPKRSCSQRSKRASYTKTEAISSSISKTRCAQTLTLTPLLPLPLHPPLHPPLPLLHKHLVGPAKLRSPLFSSSSKNQKSLAVFVKTRPFLAQIFFIIKTRTAKLPMLLFTEEYVSNG